MAVIVGQGISVSPVPDAKLSHESTGTVQNKAVADAIASEYSTSKTYSVGDVCTHDGKLYECIVDIPTAEGWTSAHWKVSNIGDVASNLNRQLNDETTGLDTKAPVILETASGAIASFDDGADSMLVKKLVAQIEPVQDLHGYSNPWPGGGGKNLLDYAHPTTQVRISDIVDNGDGSFTVTATGASALVRYLIPVTAGQTYVAYCAGVELVSGNANQMANMSVYDGDSTEATALLRNQSINDSKKTFTPTGSQALIVLAVTGGSGAGVGKIIRPQIEAGSEHTDFSPYENICPISGWTGAEIQQAGKNLFDSNVLLQASGWTVSDGVYSGYNYELDRAFNLYKKGVPGLKFKENTRYTFAANFRGENAVLTVVGFAYTDGTRSESYWSDTTETRKAITSQANKTVEFMYLSYGSRNVVYLSNCQLEESSTATDYEPYTGNQISVTFPSSADTVYGGTLTINPDRTGQLVVDRAMVDFGELSWEYAADANRFLSEILPSAKHPGSGSEKANILCSEYPVYPVNTVITMDKAIGMGAVGNITAKDSAFGTDAAAFKSAMSGVQLCYELAEPIEYTLTGNEMTTLYGANNIWASTGDTEVTYPADTKLYIDGKIAEIQATILENIGG